MSVQLTGYAGWFTRQGCFVGEFNRVAALYGTGLTTGFQAIWVQFASSDQAAVQNLPDAVGSYRTTPGSYLQTLQSDGSTAMLLQVNDDTAVVPYTVARALTILDTQMVSASQSIQRATLTSAAVAGGSNTGNAMFAASTTNIYGDPLDSTFNEVFSVLCTSQGAGFSATFSVTGQPAVSPSAWNWPQGSGVTTSISSIDPAVNGLITDGGFANWTGTGSNTPVNWDILNGSAGVTIFRGTSTGVRTGTNSAKIQSDGAQATQLAQNVSLSVNTVYAVTFQAKVNATDASGTFRVCLTDQDGNVLTNDAGTALSYTRNLNGQLTTNYQQFIVFFSTPRQLPDSYTLQIGFSAAPTSGRFLSVDLVQMVAAQPLYGSSNTGTSGPFIACFSGSTVNAIYDTYTITFTNTLTTQSFAMGMERMYSLRSQGVYIPSSLSPTIPDTLVLH